MESKFFVEIEKTMDIKTMKDFEKEVRGKIYNEMELLRKKNNDLDQFLNVHEMAMWSKIKNEEYSWLVLNAEKKKKLYRLIEIYSKFYDVISNVKSLNKKVEQIKKLKDQPVDSD